MSTLNVKKQISAILVGMFISVSSFAAITEETHQALLKKLQPLQLNVESINESPISGLYEVITESNIFYLDQSGQFLISGGIYDLDNGMQNITNNKLDEIRQANADKYFAKIKDFEKEMIIYKADNEKHVVTVFTDTTCSYCQKLHSEMADYNKLGITIRYLAFPRGGIRSNAYHTMVSIWCSDDPKAAMDSAKNRKPIIPLTCDNTVQAQYDLGVLLGIKGTPALFLDDGTVMPGYLPAARLYQALEQKK